MTPSATTPAAARLAPPATPETVAGAERLTRAYFDALNEVEAKADLEGAKLLPNYVLPTCQLCQQFNRNLLADAISTRHLHGKPTGGVNAIAHINLDLVQEYPNTAAGSIRFSTTASLLLDKRGKVLAQGPAGPLATYLLWVAYGNGQWRVSRLVATP